ncbi:hypothetical protein CO2235_200091 [Cupriavidus oxalaticus]|uniref:Uncharacterized protein n=1 Tax=Cupriavidus oxalaticus TaxID=96344 RepID=A0A375G5K2_9BURK|nr:hypothetical protein CO2235_200091 [Cupriavidus oxalaticus]
MADRQSETGTSLHQVTKYQLGDQLNGACQ